MICPNQSNRGPLEEKKKKKKRNLNVALCQRPTSSGPLEKHCSCSKLEKIKAFHRKSLNFFKKNLSNTNHKSFTRNWNNYDDFEYQFDYFFAHLALKCPIFVKGSHINVLNYLIFTFFKLILLMIIYLLWHFFHIYNAFSV